MVSNLPALFGCYGNITKKSVLVFRPLYDIHLLDEFCIIYLVLIMKGLAINIIHCLRLIFIPLFLLPVICTESHYITGINRTFFEKSGRRPDSPYGTLYRQKIMALEPQDNIEG